MRSDRILSCWPGDACRGDAQHSGILGTVCQLLYPNVRGLACAGSRDHSDRIRVATGSCVTEGGHGPHATDAGHRRALWNHHPFYIHENIRGGVAYLAELVKQFHGDLRLVMAAYAAGERPILARGLNYSSSEVYA